MLKYEYCHWKLTQRQYKLPSKLGYRWVITYHRKRKNGCNHLSMLLYQLISVSRRTHGHYGDVIMGTMAFQITSLTIVYSTVSSGADQRKHQSSASLAFVRGSHRGPVNPPHKWPVTRKMFPFDDVIMETGVHFRPLFVTVFLRLMTSQFKYIVSHVQK